mmetsp:Transcript_63793/g.201779  ORF Transcript_63793/g.201779 Transcript_63793/m.201779 type:complete len:300 (+) Transcript_63793:628-1527(+)
MWRVGAAGSAARGSHSLEKSSGTSLACPAVCSTIAMSLEHVTSPSPSRSSPSGAESSDITYTGTMRVPLPARRLPPPLPPAGGEEAEAGPSGMPSGKKLRWSSSSPWVPRRPLASMSAELRNSSSSTQPSMKVRLWSLNCPEEVGCCADLVLMDLVSAMARCSCSWREYMPSTTTTSCPGCTIFFTSARTAAMSMLCSCPGWSGLKRRWLRSTITGTKTRCAKSRVSRRTSGAKSCCTAVATTAETCPRKMASRWLAAAAFSSGDARATPAALCASRSRPMRGMALGEAVPTAWSVSRP